MAAKEALRCPTIAFGDFPEHPAGRFVDQIVRVAQQPSDDLQRVTEVVVLDVVMRGNDRDAPVPDAPRPCQLGQQCARSVLEVCADQDRGRAVDEILVVDVRAVPHVETMNHIALAR